MKINQWLLLALPLLVACKDEPINTAGGGLHSANGQTVLFTPISVYTVTSKKTSGGSTFRRGYTTAYLRATDLATGQEIKKIKIGDFQNRIEFLGSLGGKAWFFSYDPAIGLHTRNAQTLAVEQTVKDILAKNPSLSVGFTEQGYQQGIDSSGKYLFATTKDGYHYLIDPQTLQATKTDERVQRRFYSSGARRMSFAVELNDSLKISCTSGNGRNSLEVEKEQIDAKAYAFYARGRNEPISKSLYYRTVAKDTVADISFIDPVLLPDMQGPASANNRDPILKTGNTVFILSKNLLGNTFHWVITAVEVPYTGTAQQLWQQPLPSTEQLASNEKEMRFAGLAAGKLVLVFANTIITLNATDGKVLWQH